MPDRRTIPAPPLRTHACAAPPRLRGAALWLMLSAACLAGCGTSVGQYIRSGFKVGPNHCPCKPAVARCWIDEDDPRLIVAAPPLAAWWRVFNDPVLDSLVQTAYRQNLSLREAGFRVLEARANRDLVAGTLLPQSEVASGSYGHERLSLETGIESGGGRGLSGPGRNFGVWTSGAQVAWELDFWGRFRRSVEAADAQLDASVHNQRDVLVILVSDVASVYVEIRTLEQRLRCAASNVHFQRGSLAIAEAKLEEGRSSRLDVAQAVTSLARTEAIVPELEVQLRHAQNRLCVLLGMPPQDMRQCLPGGGPIPRPPVEVAVGIPADLLRRRPDVRRAEREVAAQCARIGIAETELYPAFRINGSIFVQANQFNDLFRPTALANNFGPSFTWNILNYGPIQSSIRVEQARLKQEVAQYQAAVLNANREVEDAIVAFLRAQRRARILRKGVRAAIVARDLTDDLYQAGKVEFGQVFFAEYFLVMQQDDLARAEGDIAQGLIQIHRALGGGWQVCPDEHFAISHIPPPPGPPIEEIQPGTIDQSAPR